MAKIAHTTITVTPLAYTSNLGPTQEPASAPADKNIASSNRLAQSLPGGRQGASADMTV